MIKSKFSILIEVLRMWLKSFHSQWSHNHLFAFNTTEANILASQTIFCLKRQRLWQSSNALNDCVIMSTRFKFVIAAYCFVDNFFPLRTGVWFPWRSRRTPLYTPAPRSLPMQTSCSGSSSGSSFWPPNAVLWSSELLVGIWTPRGLSDELFW